MKWNLRLVAANRGIWKASDLRRMVAERGIDISVGKMSGLWSGTPAVLRPEELDVFCAVLGCGIADLITAEPETVAAPPAGIEHVAVGEEGAGPVRRITPKPRTGRSLPPR
ncbi:helix-turn-helix domain-containing protein [Nocardia sp. NPDC051900]|uniref:helix-turn-helix domain-containing protein n=1 Tax=Nocardia sp. NPDC051900 TaxID=3364326 RepID=UPI003798DDB2